MMEQLREAQNQKIQRLPERVAELTAERNLEVNRLELPSFDGVNPRNWITKCSRYFALYKIPESQRVEVASINLTGRAAAWFTSYSAVRKNVDWTDFLLDIYNRFKDERRSRVIEDFHKLHQNGQNTLCSGNHIPIDAPHVLDKSPKSNPDISSHGWVGEGQGESSVGSHNALGEQLDELNPSNGLFEKSISSIHDKDSELCEQEEISEDGNSEVCVDEELLVPVENLKAIATSCIHDQLTFNAQGQPQGNAQLFPAEWRKFIASARCDDGEKTPATVICCADEAALCADMVIGEEFYMSAGYSKVLGFCDLVFDPGILGPGQSALQRKFCHTGFEERHHSLGHLGNQVRGVVRRSEVSPGNARLPSKEQMPSTTSISRMDALIEIAQSSIQDLSCSNITDVDEVSLVENSSAVDADFKAERGSSLYTNEDVNMEGKSLPKELNLQNRPSETCDACAVETETEKNKGGDNASSEELNPPCDMASEMSMTDREIVNDSSACLDDLEMTKEKGNHRCSSEERDMQDKVREISMSDGNMTCSSACLKEFGMEKEYEEGKTLLEELDPCDRENDGERNRQSFTFHPTIVPTTETSLYAENTKANLEREWTAAKVNTSVIEPNEMLDVHRLKKNLQMATALYKLVTERGPWSFLSRWALEAYLKGDVDKALLLHSRMAELGYDVAPSNAAWILDKYGEHSMCTGASGFCTDAERHQRAHSLWWQASEQGNEHAALLMGDTYHYGRGTDRDYECVAEVYMHAKSQSNAQAMFNLSYMHEHGQGLPYNLHLAKRYYDQAPEIDPAAKLPVTLALTSLWSWKNSEEGFLRRNVVAAPAEEGAMAPQPDEQQAKQALSDMYAKCGSNEGARHIFDRTLDQDVVSRTAMFDGYFEDGRWEERLKLFLDMVKSRIRPNEFTFAGVLNACLDQAVENIGKQVHGHVMRMGVDPASFAAFKQAVARLTFDPGGIIVAACIRSWMHSTAAAVPRRSDRILARKMVQRRHVVAVLYHALRAGLNEDQACWVLLKSCRQLSLSLEDKALKGGALMQDFPIFQLIFHFCLNMSILIRLVMVSWHRLLVVSGN